ncbi:Glucans biosynthesis protein G precursor [Lacunisphaera limnophila]|uniref:Glucans biosynthesis protein G n=1 Tax=Lacunisphaera limnophila TaxID=1838286 RepID=A0A1D8AZJ3_9BACT|nr:glucan biosynthesis protein [Lacunisphaera limnophila]AOS46297.1 Glucans biosynthesis protein G precursor [Lacunisphaera limnophila]
MKMIMPAVYGWRARVSARRGRSRRSAGTLVLQLLALTVALIDGPRTTAAEFSFELLQQRAKDVAAQPYAPTVRRVPAWVAALTYEQHRAIHFDHDHAWWQAEGLPFQLQFFHPGWLFNEPVQIHEVAAGEEQLIRFDPALFNYGPNRLPEAVPADMGFAGLRVHHALNRPDEMSELAVFLGASYFRSVARGLHYGLSARGLALNSGEPVPEEFPRFTEFWIERPVAGAAAVTVHALLDSPSVAGAYRFVITPGDATVMQVKVALYFRKVEAVIGLAPLTSMFLHGENTGWSRDDYRPEVHDSDGLLMHTGAGEWIWRPLSNPSNARASAFADRSPKGFGLLQRDRTFAHYDDLEANSHLRPSAWVEPVGDWGEGAVRLVELPTPDETNDNIVACWVPARRPVPGEPLSYEYRLHWYGTEGGRPPGGYVAATREGAVLHQPARRRMVVDFAGPGLETAADGEPLKAVVSVGEGARLIGVGDVQRIAPTGLWRAVFEIAADGSRRPIELRCYLRRGDQTLTETWSNLWTP